MKATPRLEAAKAAMQAYYDSQQHIAAEIQRIEQGAQPAIQEAGNVQSLRQSLRQRIGSMLKLGRVDTSDAEVKDLTKKIATGAHVEIAAQAVVEAKDQAIAELHAQARALNEHARSLQQELLEAQLDAAGIEINAELIPALRAASDVFHKALANLVGAGGAHTQLAQQAREQYGLSVTSLGVSLGSTEQFKLIDIPIVGFGIADNNGFNTLRIDMYQSVQRSAEAALERWRGA